MCDRNESGLSCVDEAVGQDVLDLLDSGIDPQRARLLHAHVQVCAHCRMTLDLNHRLGEGIRSGALLDGSGRARRRNPWLGFSAAAALAAGLALCFLLPPRPIENAMVVRGGTVEGSVPVNDGVHLNGSSVPVAWAPRDGADSYLFRASREDGTVVAEFETTENSATLENLDPDNEYEVRVSSIPEYLDKGRPQRIVFRTGGAVEFATDRVSRAHRAAQMVSLLGLALGAGFLLHRRA